MGLNKSQAKSSKTFSNCTNMGTKFTTHLYKNTYKHDVSMIYECGKSPNSITVGQCLWLCVKQRMTYIESSSISIASSLPADRVKLGLFQGGGTTNSFR